jgi:hypothetical protein
MTRVQRRKVTVLILLAIVALMPVAGCRRETSRWDEVQEGSKKATAVSGDAVRGSALNAFFPESGDDHKITFTQEKTGFAEAKLTIDGKESATLSISDTISNPSAAEKYQESEEKLDGYPMAEIGSKGTGILVAGRFQVQVRSESADFDRQSWLLEFDLDGLSKLNE